MLRTIDRQSDLSLKVVMGFKQNYVITFLGCKCNICLTTTESKRIFAEKLNLTYLIKYDNISVARGDDISCFRKSL